MYKNLSKIFESNLNRKHKLIKFNLKKTDKGENKYLPPVSKEWKNTIYSYYKNEIKNTPINFYSINEIIRSYFSLYFNDKLIFNTPKWKRKSLWKRRKILKRIYASKVELKNTNSIVIISSYILNVKKNRLYNKYLFLYSYIQKKILTYWKFKLKIKIKKLKIKKLIDKKLIGRQIINIFSYKYKLLTEYVLLYLNLYLTQAVKYSYNKKLKILRKYQLEYNLNYLKFVKNNFLFILGNILTKILKKKVIFNLINLKSLAFNPDIFTHALTLKLKKRKKFNVLRSMKSILRRAYMPKVNTIIERSRHIKKKFILIPDNKYKFNDSSLTCINKPYSFNDLLNKIHSIDNISVYKKIFNYIKYKNMGGIRLEVKGRLTKRYRADRAIYKLRWKGGLKNINSSFNGLSTVVYRGYLKPNLTYSFSKSKRRIGSFAVKGWISGK